MKLSNPWPKGYTINAASPYGMRYHPIYKKMMMHHGVDVGGTFSVTAAGDGVVKLVGKDWHTLTDKQKARQTGGNTVLIDHGGVVTVYYHGEHQSALVVGQRVKKGDFIFTSGTTGSSTDDHLHFEVRAANGRMGNTLNPEDYLGKQEKDNTLKVTGKLDKPTWIALQTALKGHKLYSGNIDGIPGRLTYTALQRWSDAPETGKLDIATRKAVQVRIGVKVDGIWGTGTISELQGELIRGLAGVRKPEPAEPKPKPKPKPKPVIKAMSDGLRKFFNMKANQR
jgi:hypothetical protein